MRLIWKLLRKHISILELLIFFVANLIGMTVILAGVQIYSDIKPLLSGEKSLIGSDYMIITRHVERIGGKPRIFTKEDIEELERQEFVLNLGRFQSSKFEVNGSIMFNERRLSTMLFFEAVPDNFVDVKSDKWVFERRDKIIPIILPRNYLNLYNFGFSQTQNLPQLTEDIIKRVELDIELSGNWRKGKYKGQVVGFSDRLNTILVPISFMEWANKYYASSTDEGAARLIIEVNNPTDPAITHFLEERGYVAEEKPSESSKAMSVLKVSIMIIVGIGVIFSLLSTIIFTLSIYLLLQKNIDKLENLVLIGYKSRTVAIPYNLLTILLNLLTMAIAVVVVAIVQREYILYLMEISGSELVHDPTAAAIAGVVLSTIIILFNTLIINRKIKRISCKR